MLAIVGVVVLVLAVGGGAAWLGSNWNRSSTSEVSGDYYGRSVDKPRPSPTYQEPGGTGGSMGVGLATSLTASGYSCTRTVGERSAVLTCFQTTEKPVPTLASVTALIGGDQVVDVKAEVAVDPAWTRLDAGTGNNFDRYAPDVSAAATRAFGIVALATIPDGERPPLDKAMRTSGIEQSTENVETSVGTVTVAIRRAGSSTFALERDEDNATRLDYSPGLSLVTPAQIESAVEAAGLSCDRAADSMTCTKGTVRLQASYPRPTMKGTDHTITSVTVRGEAPDGRAEQGLVDAAKAVTGVVVGTFGGDMPVRAWAGNCFARTTVRTVAGASTLTCTPEFEGTARSPRVAAYEFSVKAVDY
ncbi:hypothetical protein [Actinopolymorpha pittospori]|uniref:Uncharacterized protein n=1 Tax=Actinopolymorpha pittospori TaxID=648752 RepID=A0A927N1B1_9ACTN|nr:hypothetical protein [Actinopolymorpha pittospori]MBE1610451.1 hypothetical protein [Actinopolymorpha pittospori]